MNKVYTPAQLAFIKRRRRMPRLQLLAAFKLKFRRSGITLLKLQDLCNRYGWSVGSRKGRRKGHSTRYSKAELSFVKRRRKMARRDLHAAFVEKFGRRDVSCEMIRELCVRRGWQTDPRDRRRRMLGRTKFTKEERAFLKLRQTLPRRELHAVYVEQFGRDMSIDAFKALGDRLGLRTGRTGQFEKGIVPANKGKKMPYNANSARTQFKKGHLSGRAREVQKPIGFERISDGYLVRKINNGLPMQSRWRGVHQINWEKRHGPVPAGHVLKCLDGNRLNVKLSNWELISRGDLAARNGRFRGVKVPAEFEAVAMEVTKLARQLKQKARKEAA